MSQARPSFRHWIPVLIWMALIFSASSDSLSFQHSSRIMAPLLRWLFPQISELGVDRAVTFARKCAHVTEYAILGVLLVRAFRKLAEGDSRAWSWPQARWALLLVALFAASDEFHQVFVPTREASVRDVVIDTLGGIVGLLLFWAVGRCRNWWGDSSAG